MFVLEWYLKCKCILSVKTVKTVKLKLKFNLNFIGRFAFDQRNRSIFESHRLDIVLEDINLVSLLPNN